MDIVGVRTVLAWAGVWLAFAVFAAHATYGVYLDLKLGRLAGYERVPRDERWNPERYFPGAEKWLERDRRWHRSRNWVWLGSILAGNVWYLLLKP